MQFEERLELLQSEFDKLITRKNEQQLPGNGLFERYKFPVLTAAHTPLFWRYDLNKATNPYLMTRFGINSVLNAGAIKWNGKYLLITRVEGWDRKSFFAIAESNNGIDNFTFWDFPVNIPDSNIPETNIYDIRLTAHEDGWIYGLFCTERRDNNVPAEDQSSAIAQCGIVRTKDLLHWERLPDLKTNSMQQRNVALHAEFVNGKYMLYTRPQDGFINTGKGGGIAVGFCNSMQEAVITEEKVIDRKIYHTVYEAKNGQGPAPIKTNKGWLHLAHGVRNTAAGLRYVLYMFVTDIKDPSKVIYKPSGYFLAPENEERIGDVSNVVFCNGWIADDDNKVFIYYASSDTRMHVATTTIERLLDYCINTPEDGFSSHTSVASLLKLIKSNLHLKNTQSEL